MTLILPLVMMLLRNIGRSAVDADGAAAEAADAITGITTDAGEANACDVVGDAAVHADGVGGHDSSYTTIIKL